MTKIGEFLNEYGVGCSTHICPDCKEIFEVHPDGGDNWGGCLDSECPSYDPNRDIETGFGGRIPEV